MDIQGYRQAKYRIIARDLEHRLREGTLRFRESFFTREELAHKYKVSPLTANKVLKLLEADGILSCGRGRRARLLIANRPENWVPEHRIRILVTVPDDTNGTPSTGSVWLTTYLKNILRGHGHTVIICTPGECDEVRKADAVLFLDTPAPDTERKLQETGKPYVRLSFQNPAENTIYLMPQPFLDRSLIYFVRSKVEHIVFIHGGESPIEHLLCCPQIMADFESKFRQYCNRGKIEHTVPLSLDVPESEVILKRLTDTGSKDRTGFFCGNELLGEHLATLLNKSDVPLIRSCPFLKNPVGYPIIDLDLPRLGDEMIAMLYRQLNAGSAYDAGALHIPQFYEIPFCR